MAKNLGKADFHIHSKYSDGRPTVLEILEYTERFTDLNVIAITDHDTIKGALESQALIKEKNYHFEVVIGEEVSCREGHVLALYINKPIPPNLSVHKTLEKIHQQGGIAIAAHPFQFTHLKNPDIVTMNGVGADVLIKERANFDAVEIVNATPTLGEENLSADLLNKTILFCGEVGSSDAHIIEAIGKGYTLFEGKTANDLKRALKHHQIKAMYHRWTIMALLKYLFFFIPEGWRLFEYTLFHGRDHSKK